MWRRFSSWAMDPPVVAENTKAAGQCLIARTSCGQGLRWRLWTGRWCRPSWSLRTGGGAVQSLGDVGVDLLGRRGGAVALHHLATRVHEELGEVPLDRLGAERAGFSALRCSKIGCACGPLTSILANSGNVTSYFVLQKVAISSSDPDSCAPN